MAINKVTFGDEVLIDLTLDTVDDTTVVKGKLYHKPNGEVSEGTNTNNADTSADTVTEDKVKEGITFHKADGSSAVGTNTDVNVSDTTAIESDVLSGKIFHKSDGTKAWGTYAEPPIFPLTVRVDELRDLIISIPSGGWNPVTYGLAEEEKAKVIPENIKKDVSILGVTGTLEEGIDVSDTTADAGSVLSGVFFYTKDGVKTLGEYHPPIVPALGSKNVKVDSLQDMGEIAPPNTGWNQIRYGLAEEEKAKVIPENIKKDVTILGITGTLESGSNVKNGAITLKTTDQEIDCGFAPTQVMVTVGAGRTTYFGFGINTNGTTVGSRLATSGSASATSPVTITLTENGFKVKALSTNYALASTYVAIG